jgi:serine/threonine-protein kinase
MKALAKNKRERWQTADDFLNALNVIHIGDASRVRIHFNQIPAKKEGQTSYHPEHLTEITRKLATHVGPIASVLVKRASSSCNNLRELCDQVANEIESADAKQKFLDSVRSIRAAN